MSWLRTRTKETPVPKTAPDPATGYDPHTEQTTPPAEQPPAPLSPWAETDPDASTRRFRGNPQPADDPTPITAPPAPPRPADTGSLTRSTATGHSAPGILFTPPPPKVDAGNICEGCGRAMPTEQELIENSLALLGARILDVVPEMYRRLFIDAPTLKPLFAEHCPELIIWEPLPAEDPTAVVDPGQVDYATGRYWRINPDAAQVDLVFGAVKAVVSMFNLDDEASMERLDAALAGMGRGHTRFDPPARIEEYAAVTTTFLGNLADLAGPAWTEPLAAAWRKRLEYAAGSMLRAQATYRRTGVGRRRREP